jgi:PST family polysaccharide transporter
MPQSLKNRTIKGLTWSVLASFVKQVLTFTIGVILARLLSPAEFGIIGMIAVFTGLVSTFMEQGLGSAIIHKQDIEKRHLDSIFWFNVGIGFFCTIAFMILSFPIAKFYKNPVLQPITFMISFNFFLGSFNIVQNALLNKKVDFKRLAIIDTLSVLVGGFIGIFLALAKFGVWALVWQTLATTFTTVIVMWVTSSWRPGIVFNISALKEIFKYSTNLLGFNILNYWTRNFDNLLIGRFIGSFALGIYAKAYQLMLLPLTQVSQVISRVMFPILSEIQHDKKKIKSIYLKSIQCIALITFPLMLTFWVVNNDFVLAVYGEKWESMIPILYVLILCGMIQSIGTTTGWIYNSIGRTDIQFKWGILAAIVRTAGFIIGLRWGVMGVAISYFITGYFILWYPSWSISGRLIDLKFSEMLRCLASPFYCAIAAAVSAWILGISLLSHWGHLERLFILSVSSMLIYLVLIHVFSIGAYTNVSKLIKDYLNSRFLGSNVPEMETDL